MWLRLVMKSRINNVVMLILISVVCGFGCSRKPFIPLKVVYKQEKRIRSPDFKVDAVLITGDAGAVTSEETYVFILPAEKTINMDSLDRSGAVFMGDHLKGFDVRWRENNLLIIRYDEARIDGFKNHFDVFGNDRYTYPVEIRLEPTTSDFSLPQDDRQPIQIK